MEGHRSSQTANTSDYTERHGRGGQIVERVDIAVAGNAAQPNGGQSREQQQRGQHQQRVDDLKFAHALDDELAHERDEQNARRYRGRGQLVLRPGVVVGRAAHIGVVFRGDAENDYA